MSTISYLKEINPFSFLISVITVLVFAQFIIKLVQCFVTDWLGLQTKSMREREKEHELVISTANELKNIVKKREQDYQELNKLIDEKLISFYSPYRKQSIDIQHELKDTITILTETSKNQNKQIEALMCGTKELLGDKIDQRYEKYVKQLHGIPENEVDEFRAIYDAYAGLNGNHGRERKYNYVMTSLPVIQVETKIMDNEENK